MIRALAFLLLAGSAVAASVWLAEHPGTLTLDAMGYRIETSLLLAIVAIVLLALLLIGAVMLIMKLASIPSQLSARRALHRQTQGIASLTQTMARLSASQWPQAEKALSSAAHQLGHDHPAVLLLGAQLARAQGQSDRVRKQLDAMLTTPQTAWLAHRGLAEQDAREGNAAQAKAHAEKALATSPQDRTMQLIMLDAAARDKQWDVMQRQLRQAQKHGALSAQEVARYRAASHLAQASEQPGEALHHAKQAYRLQAEWIAAQRAWLEQLQQTGKQRRFRAVMQQAWQSAPEAPLATLWLNATDNDPARKRIKYAQALIASHPDHVESHLLMGRLYLALEQPEEARRHARAALEQANDARIYRLFADIERAAGSDETALRQWLSQATSAPDGTPAWHCAKCGHTQERWQIHCAQCDTFDSLRFERDPRTHRGITAPAVA